MQYARATDCPAVSSSGVVVPSKQAAGDATNLPGCKLQPSATYFFALQTESAPLESVHAQWDAGVVVTFTIETCNFPPSAGSADIADVADISQVKGAWLQEDPSTAYITTKSTDGTTGGATVTNATIVVAGGTAGGAMIHLGNLGSKRCRLKAVVGGTGGVVRVRAHGKA